MASEPSSGKPVSLDTEANRLKVLTEIASDSRERRIEPAISKVSRLGFYFPRFAELIGCEPGEEIEILESLADLGCLSRQIYEQVDLCPFCLNSDLRYRRLCPNCRSTLIVKKEVLHHFRCGWVGLEEEAADERALICPKCHKHMRHIGIDYERAAQSYYCTVCKKIFSQPLEQFLSLSCGREVAKDGTMIAPIFAYKLTPVGKDVVNRQSFNGIPTQRGIIETDYNLYTRNYVERRLEELMNRYLRYQVGFSAALISIDQFTRWTSEKGHVVASNAVKLVASVLRGETRGVDLPGLYDEHTFLVLLPQTGHKGAKAFAKRFSQRLTELSVPHLEETPSVSIAVGSCPEDGEDSSSIVTQLIERLKRCQQKGGNTILGPEDEKRLPNIGVKIT